jgi:hypothetical protein
MGTTLSVNILFASGPDLDNIPYLESLDMVAKLTTSPEAMKENPERLFLR